MNSVFVILVHVITDQSAKMLLVQHDDMVQDLAAATAYPSLRYAILPGCLHARPLGLQPRRLQKHDDICVEFRIPVQNHVMIRAGVRKGLPQLLDDPLRRRMSGYVEVQNLSTTISITKKQCSSLKVNAGTVQKSKATSTWR